MAPSPLGVAAVRPWDADLVDPSVWARPSWWARAACRGAGPAGFTTGTPGHGTNWRTDVCQTCRARPECAAEAVALIDNNIRAVGVWAGVVLQVGKPGRGRAIAALRAVAGETPGQEPTASRCTTNPGALVLEAPP